MSPLYSSITVTFYLVCLVPLNIVGFDLITEKACNHLAYWLITIPFSCPAHPVLTFYKTHHIPARGTRSSLALASRVEVEAHTCTAEVPKFMYPLKSCVINHLLIKKKTKTCRLRAQKRQLDLEYRIKLM